MNEEQIYNTIMEKQLHSLDWWKTVLLNSIFYDDRVGKLLNRDSIEVTIDGLIAAATSAERERCASAQQRVEKEKNK